MEQLTFEAGKNMVQDSFGHIHLTGYGVSTPYQYYYNDDVKTCQKYRLDYGNNTMVLASTHTNLTGVHHIPREWFLRKVDVYDLANKSFKKNIDLTKRELHDAISVAGGYIVGYKDAYNANKAEFTMEQAKKIYNAGLMSLKTFDEIINIIIYPIKLPQSITVTKDFKQVIETIWKD